MTPCPQARAFARRVEMRGGTATVLLQPKSHAEINADLGTPGAYSDAVDQFVRQLGL